MINRRAFITMMGGSVIAAPLVTEAQQAGRVPRIGLITGLSESTARSRVEAFGQALRELGFIEDVPWLSSVSFGTR